MIKKIFILQFLCVIAFTKVSAKDHVITLIDAIQKNTIKSPYKECEDVTVIALPHNQYKLQAEKWKANDLKCQNSVQVTEEAGITRLSSLHEGAQYLNFATKVAEKVINNLDKSSEYAQCSSSCFQGASTCGTVNCSERRSEILHNLKVQSRKIRMALALSQDASYLQQVNVHNVLTINDDLRFNKNLRDLSFEIPNPLGNVEMQPGEIEHAREIIRHERAKVESDYKEILVKSGKRDSAEFRNNWISATLMNSIDLRQEEQLNNYRRFIYEESPLFAVIEKPIRFQNGDDPIWSDKQISEAFLKLSKNAIMIKSSVKDSINNGQLEFSRIKGEALTQWLLQLIPGTNNHNDLLFYINMKNQVEEVLKEDKSLCAVATTLSNRLQNKAMQNNFMTLTGSLAGGVFVKGLSRATAGIFRIGRALTTTEASQLTGLAVGSTYLGDSFRQYNNSVAETISGEVESSSIDSAKFSIEVNLVLAPFLFRNGKDKNVLDKINLAIRNNVLSSSELTLLKSETGRKIIYKLASDIKNNNPHYFSNPNNIDLFFKRVNKSLHVTGH